MLETVRSKIDDIARRIGRERGLDAPSDEELAVFRKEAIETREGKELMSALVTTRAMPTAPASTPALSHNTPSPLSVEAKPATNTSPEQFVADQLAWLATMPPAKAHEIADRNRTSVGNWGQLWIDQHPFTPATKADTALAAYETGLAAYAKANPTVERPAVAFASTAEGRALETALNTALASSSLSGGQPAASAPPSAPRAGQAFAAPAFAALETALTTWCASKGIDAVWTKGLETFAATPEGKPLVDAYNASQRSS